MKSRFTPSLVPKVEREDPSGCKLLIRPVISFRSVDCKREKHSRYIAFNLLKRKNEDKDPNPASCKPSSYFTCIESTAT